MILIFGGSYQGKLDYAINNYKCDKSDIFQCEEEVKSIDFSKKIINSFHLFILEKIKENTDPVLFIKENLDEFKDKIIICDDINSGVVPIDEVMRKWREAVGKCLVFISKNSDEVFRLFCGIPSKLK